MATNTGFQAALAQFLIVFSSRTLFAITGFGEGLVYQIGFHICSIFRPDVCSGELTAAIINLTIEGVICVSIQAWVLRKRINWILAAYMLPLGVLGTVIGTQVLFSLSSSNLMIMKRIMGILLLVMGLIKLYIEAVRYKRNASEVSTGKPFDMKGQRIKVVTASTSLLSGLCNGLFALPGAPFMIFVLYFNVSSEEWRGTSAVVAVVNLWLRLLLLASTGELQAISTMWPILMGLVSGSLLGITLGNLLSKKVSAKWFRRGVLCILLIGSISIIGSGLHVNQMFTLCSGIGLAIGCIIWGAQGGASRYFPLEHSTGNSPPVSALPSEKSGGSELFIDDGGIAMTDFGYAKTERSDYT